MCESFAVAINTLSAEGAIDERIYPAREFQDLALWHWIASQLGKRPVEELGLFLSQPCMAGCRLERKPQHDVELMWVNDRLEPDFKTIADFRKLNNEAIRLECREFLMLYCKPILFAGAAERGILIRQNYSDSYERVLSASLHLADGAPDVVVGGPLVICFT